LEHLKGKNVSSSHIVCSIFFLYFLMFWSQGKGNVRGKALRNKKLPVVAQGVRGGATSWRLLLNNPKARPKITFLDIKELL
jgi:hypothetical protein